MTQTGDGLTITMAIRIATPAILGTTVYAQTQLLAQETVQLKVSITMTGDLLTESPLSTEVSN